MERVENSGEWPAKGGHGAVFMGCHPLAGNKEGEEEKMKEREEEVDIYKGEVWRYYNYAIPLKWDLRLTIMPSH